MSEGAMQSADPNARTPESRSTEFVAVQGGQETTSAESLLVIAYLVMWALLLGFIFMTWRRQSRIEARIGELDRELKRATEKR
jgi:CcmD family protein